MNLNRKPHELLNLTGQLEPVKIDNYFDSELSTHREIINIYIFSIFVAAILLLITMLL